MQHYEVSIYFVYNCTAYRYTIIMTGEVYDIVKLQLNVFVMAVLQLMLIEYRQKKSGTNCTTFFLFKIYYLPFLRLGNGGGIFEGPSSPSPAER